MNKFEKSVKSLQFWNDKSQKEKEESCNNIIEIANERELTSEEIKKLALGLADTGDKWKWAHDIKPTIDIASTGGAGSLTTLLCPFLIATQGIYTPQVSVHGSIAGAIDTLGIIPGYNFELSYKEMENSLRESKIGNTLNTDGLAPADLDLFNERSKKNAKDLPDLVIASLLSKKIALNVDKVIFDIRVSPVGNFGHTQEEAEKNSKKMVLVAQSLGINCICILTNHNISTLPFYGRFESFKALWSLANGEELDAWTMEHIDTCITIAAYGVSLIKGWDIKSAEESIRLSIEDKSLLSTLKLNIIAQGSSLQSIDELIDRIKFGEKKIMKSPFEAFIEHIDLIRIRNIFSKIQRISDKKRNFTSKLGLVLKVREGTLVKKGDAIMEVRISPEIAKEFTINFEDIIIFNKDAPSFHSNNKIYTVINHA